MAKSGTFLQVLLFLPVCACHFFWILKPGSPRQRFWTSLVPLVCITAKTYWYSSDIVQVIKMHQPQATTLISMNKKIQMNRQTLFEKIYKYENNNNLFLEIYSSYTKLGLLWRLDQSQCWSDWLLPSKLRSRELEISLLSVTIWP